MYLTANLGKASAKGLIRRPLLLKAELTVKTQVTVCIRGYYGFGESLCTPGHTRQSHIMLDFTHRNKTATCAERKQEVFVSNRQISPQRRNVLH